MRVQMETRVVHVDSWDLVGELGAREAEGRGEVGIRGEGAPIWLRGVSEGELAELVKSSKEFDARVEAAGGLFTVGGDAPEAPIEEWAMALCEALATAFGGYSQVPMCSFGAAAKGWRVNKGGYQPGRTRALEAIAEVLIERWGCNEEETRGIRAEVGAGWAVDPDDRDLEEAGPSAQKYA